MKAVNPKRVFVWSRKLSPFQTQITPIRVAKETIESIDHISDLGEFSKAEVVRYCLEFALANIDWFEAVQLKREFLIDAKSK